MITNLVAYSLINGGGTPQPSQPDVSDWVTSAEMPSGTTAIPDDAFSGFSNLRNIEFNSELTTIGARAFYNCDFKLVFFSNITELGRLSGQQKTEKAVT